MLRNDRFLSNMDSQNVQRRINRRRRAPARMQGRARNTVQPQPQRSLGVVMTREAARMQMDPIRNGIRVRNREIIKSITRTSTTGAIPFGADGVAWRFNNLVTTEPASPGIGTMGPYLWIGQLATLYDKYVIKKLSFEFVPSQPFTATGQVALFWDSDPEPVVPTTYQQISGNVYAKAVHVSQPCSLQVRPNQTNRLPQYQTSVGNTSTSLDTATSGWLFFVNQPGSLPSTTTGVVALGTIWVEYEVEFLNPTNPTLGQPPAETSTEDEIAQLATQVAALTRMLDAVRNTRAARRDPPKLVVPDLSKPQAPAFVLPSSDNIGPSYKVNGTAHTEL